MNPAIKAKWVAALRSGEYKQGMGNLRDAGYFCCLGVLSDLHSKETGCKWTQQNDGVMSYLFQSGMPPEIVMDWAGLKIITVEIDGKVKTLDRHNDKGATFAQIAQAIEDQL